MMSTVTYDNGRVFTVKNLGWLLRHKRDIVSLTITPIGNGCADMEVSLELVSGKTAVYRTQWASMTICREFINRRWYLADKTVYKEVA
jgi:hypothetical protein